MLVIVLIAQIVLSLYVMFTRKTFRLFLHKWDGTWSFLIIVNSASVVFWHKIISLDSTLSEAMPELIFVLKVVAFFTTYAFIGCIIDFYIQKRKQ